MPYQANHVAIDINQLLYPGIRTKINLEHYISKLYRELDEILHMVEPTSSLILVLDGPAPFAKMLTQRKRGASASPETSLLTPGTILMNGMNDIILGYILQRCHRPQFRNLTVFISGPRSPGEGELKIVEWVNTIMPSYNESLVICGTDSDIILQALSLPYLDKVMVLQSGSKEYSDAFCNISSLSVEMIKDTNIDHSLLNFPQAIRLELVLIMLLQGNDYMPRLQGMTLNKAMKAYTKTIKSRSTGSEFLLDLDNNTFNFPNLLQFLKEMCDGNDRYLRNCTDTNLLIRITNSNKLCIGNFPLPHTIFHMQ